MVGSWLMVRLEQNTSSQIQHRYRYIVLSFSVRCGSFLIPYIYNISSNGSHVNSVKPLFQIFSKKFFWDSLLIYLDYADIIGMESEVSMNLFAIAVIFGSPVILYSVMIASTFIDIWKGR